MFFKKKKKKREDFYKIEIPTLDSVYDLRKEIKTENQENVFINMHKMTCTCNRFNEIHSSFEVDDIRRLCKHLIHEYIRLVADERLDEFKNTVLKHGHDVKANILFLKDNDGNTCDNCPVILYDKSNPWWDVYAPDIKENLRCYGYNILEMRWANEEAPPIIKNSIEKFIDEYVSSKQAEIKEEFYDIRNIVKKINSKKDLRNLERRLERAENKYSTQETTVLDEIKLDILYKSFEIARDKFI